jgi:cell division protein FtsZ
VNEASSIIQEAAHEDANIIFGAVLDEQMGDEVKFTVIATGFRDEMPARRERMMNTAALPTSRQEAPPPRIVMRPLVERAPEPAAAPEEIEHPQEPVMETAHVAEHEAAPVAEEPESGHYEQGAYEPPVQEVAAPPVAAAPVMRRAPFASQEMEPEPVVYEAPAVVFEASQRDTQGEPQREPEVVHEPAQRENYPTSSYYEAARQQAWHEEPRVAVHEEHAAVEHVPVVAYSEPEPVRAYAPVIVEHIAEHTAEHVAPTPEPAREPELVPVKASVFDDDFFRQPKPELPVVEDTRWPEAKVPSFAGYAGDAPAAAETDELDIPAFLRRNH